MSQARISGADMTIIVQPTITKVLDCGMWACLAEIWSIARSVLDGKERAPLLAVNL